MRNRERETGTLPSGHRSLQMQMPAFEGMPFLLVLVYPDTTMPFLVPRYI
jgi:hypothetical protein